MGCSPKKEVHSNTALPQKTRKISKTKQNKTKTNVTYHLKEKEEKTKPKVSRRKEIIKIREEINKREIKRTIEKKSIKPRASFLKG